MTTQDERRKALNDMMTTWHEWEESPEGQAFREAEDKNREYRRKLFDELEEEFKDQGLTIYSWSGACPTQGFGKLGDDFWYFRFRWNNATLRVGPYVDEIEEAEYQKAKKRADEDRKKNPDDLFAQHYHPEKAPAEGNVYPTVATRWSAKEGPTPGDDYNGYMEDAEQARDYLRALILALEPVPEGTR